MVQYKSIVCAQRSQATTNMYTMNICASTALLSPAVLSDWFDIVKLYCKIAHGPAAILNALINVSLTEASETTKWNCSTSSWKGQTLRGGQMWCQSSSFSSLKRSSQTGWQLENQSNWAKQIWKTDQKYKLRHSKLKSFPKIGQNPHQHPAKLCWLSAHTGCMSHSHHGSCSSSTQNLKVGRSGDKRPRLNMMSSNAAGPKNIVCLNSGNGASCPKGKAFAPPPLLQQQSQYSAEVWWKLPAGTKGRFQKPVQFATINEHCHQTLWTMVNLTWQSASQQPVSRCLV